MRRYSLIALLVVGHAAALTGLGMLVGCQQQRGDRECADKLNCFATDPQPPPPADVLAAQQRASAVLRAEVESGRIAFRQAVNWNEYPNVEWRACPFYVAGGNCTTNFGGCDTQCAKAMTASRGGYIVVSTFKPSETISLVEWETRNSFLIRGGRGDLAS